MTVRRPQPRLLAVLLVAAFCLQGCFTGMLWDLREVRDDRTVVEATHGDEDHEGGLGIGWKIALTPLAVLLDVITWPIQQCFGDDDPPNPRRGSRGC